MGSFFRRGDGINAAGVEPVDTTPPPAVDEFEATWNRFKALSLQAVADGNASDRPNDESMWNRTRDVYKSQGQAGIDMMNATIDKIEEGDYSMFKTAQPREFIPDDAIPQSNSNFFTSRQPPIDYNRFEHIVENAISNLLNPVVASMTVEPGNDQMTDLETTESEMDRATMEYLASKSGVVESAPENPRGTSAPVTQSLPGDAIVGAAVDGVDQGQMSEWTLLVLGGIAVVGLGLVGYSLVSSNSRGASSS